MNRNSGAFARAVARMLLTGALTSTLGASAAALAQGAAPVTRQAETIDIQIVCKNIKAIGTKIARRVCGTPEQWAAQKRRTTDDAQEAMRQVRERASIVVSQPGNRPGGLGGN